ncbi:MAG: hypothetical protein ABWX65_08820 [Mycetocola sp.]
MSIQARTGQRLSSPFTEVREAARDELLMGIAGIIGVVVIVAVIVVVVAVSGLV